MSGSRRHRGSALIVALLLSALLLVLGTANLLETRARFRARAAAARGAQAEALALAGLEDLRVKLERDPRFPPRGDVQQTVFSYTEEVRDAAGRSLGGYRVVCDTSLRGLPWQLLLVSSTGWAEPPGEARTAVTLRGEVDLAVTVRGGTAPNPAAYGVRRVESLPPGL